MAAHNTTGSHGEQMAADYFIKNGYTIMERNWRHSNWEVDLIASRDNILHFIEVKTRRSKIFGHPEENVSKKKIESLTNAAEEYLFRHPEWTRIQFDILSIAISENEAADYFLIEDVYL